MTITPAEMREWAATLEEIAPRIETDYGPGQVATYGLCWESMRWAADQIERLERLLTESQENELRALRSLERALCKSSPKDAPRSDS